MSGLAKRTEQSSSPEGIVCAKCRHVNARGRNVCASCGAHLHVVCHHCGQRNARSSLQCSECGHNLHRSVAKRAFRGLFPKNSNNLVLQIVLVIIAILVGYMLIHTFSNYRVPAPE
jgi:hypothetical protein